MFECKYSVMAKYSLIAITFLTEKQKEGRKDNLYDVHVTV